MKKIDYIVDPSSILVFNTRRVIVEKDYLSQISSDVRKNERKNKSGSRIDRIRASSTDNILNIGRRSNDRGERPRSFRATASTETRIYDTLDQFFVNNDTSCTFFISLFSFELPFFCE